MAEPLNNILLLSADTPERLRASDVDRVMSEAQQVGRLEEFKAWILKQDLQQRTRANIEEWTTEDGGTEVISMGKGIHEVDAKDLNNGKFTLIRTINHDITKKEE